METIVEVSIFGKKAGVLAWDKNASVGIFEFYDSFAKQGLDIAPLTMPLAAIQRGEKIFRFIENQGKTFKGLPGMLADSLPDDYGNAIINEYFSSKGLSSVEVTPVDRLCYIGSRAMGALEFKPAVHDQSLNDSNVIELDMLTALASEVLNQRKKFQASLKRDDPSVKDILKVGTSAGGAKAKAVIAWNEKTNEVRSGQVKAPYGFTYWILKFDGVEDNKLRDNPIGIGSVEYAYHRMALDCGITMTPCRLFHDGKYAHFMTRRFDRLDDGTKLHTQTLCAIAHLDRDGRHSYEQGFEVMRRLHMPETHMEQFYRRMVFNVVARNQDDHTKNHSFIMNETGEWELAPAYDLLYAHNASGKWTNQHQLSLNNKRDDYVYSDLTKVAQTMGIRQARAIIDQVIEVVSHWPGYAHLVGALPEHTEYIRKHHRLLTK